MKSIVWREIGRTIAYWLVTVLLFVGGWLYLQGEWLMRRLQLGKCPEQGENTVNEEKPPIDEIPPADFTPVPPNASTYVQVAFWVAQHVRNQAAQSEYTEDQLIEQFAQNVRKINNPDWRPDA